jgi:hypothetical protein
VIGNVAEVLEALKHIGVAFIAENGPEVGDGDLPLINTPILDWGPAH